MRVYRCKFHDSDAGSLVSWHANKVEAQRTLRMLQITAHQNGKGGLGVESVEPVDIPTDKAGLLGWLNRNFDTDNG